MLSMPHELVDCAVLVAIFLWMGLLRRRRSSPLPPGPKGYPIVGNLFDLMVPELWETARMWGNKYGGIIFLKSLGQPIIILNSYDIAVDLLERRSLNYSDRPNSIMVNELQRWDWFLSSMSYGEAFKRLRTPVQKFFESSNIIHYEDVQTNEVRKLLRSLLQTPTDYDLHIRKSMASTIMMITYGHEAESFDDPFVTLAKNASEHIDMALQQGVFLVDVIPWLKYVPKWFPGAGFQVIAEHGARLSHDLRYLPYFHARDKILSGGGTPSFISQQIEERTGGGTDISEPDEEIISATCGICYSAGANTSITGLKFFILAMMVFPEVQRRAQDEIDCVVGGGRLPELSDRPQLPYCTALLKEIHRWNPILALGVPHATKAPDTYAGYFIPAKAIVIPNHWAMLMDPVEYPDPDIFKPERFLPTPDKHMPRDPSKIAFGFGRRVCPGKPLAENTIFLVATQILAVFNISKVRSADGSVIESAVKISTEGIVRHPEPFECTIEPRSTEAAGLVDMA